MLDGSTDPSALCALSGRFLGGNAGILGSFTPSEMTVDLQGAIATLEEDIVFGRRHPRERLVEDELMARFGLSRHAVREVLAALDRLGLVERRRNVGACVRSFGATQVAELYALRELLEAQAARSIVLPVAEADLQALRQIQRRHDAAVKRGDAPAVFRANLAFHEALFALCGNATLRAAIAEYARQTHPIRFASLVNAGYRVRAAEEHHAMLDALARGDRRALVAACRAHLRPSRDAYLAAERLRAQPPGGDQGKSVP
jgi:DNA-binding GntR family transcriptional regulator